MTVHVTLEEAQAKLAELLEIAANGEIVTIEREGREPLYVTSRFPKRRLGVWSKYGPLTDPYLFLRPDPELEEAADGPIFPSE